MIDLDNVMNIHKCIDVSGLSECLEDHEWHIVLGNRIQIEFAMWSLFENEYTILNLMSDIEDLIPCATCYVSQYNDLCIVNLEKSPEYFEF